MLANLMLFTLILNAFKKKNANHPENSYKPNQ